MVVAIFGKMYMVFSLLFAPALFVGTESSSPDTIYHTNDEGFVDMLTSEEEQNSAINVCAELGGESRVTLSELFGEDQVFCTFEEGGECTQGELLNNVCYKQK